MSRTRVLLLAEAANPEWASVPLVGWSHAEALSRVADVHLVTQIRNREAIERTGLVAGRDFTAIDSEATARRLWRIGEMLRGGAGKGWTTATAFAALAYYHFEHLVWKQFGERIRAGEFDVVHRLTPVSPTHPSLIAKRCARAGVPFVLGPLNGGVAWPREFDGARRAEREWLSYLRSAYRLMPGYRSTLRYAARILIGSRATLEQIPARYRHKCVYMPENAVDPARFIARRQRIAGKPLRLVFLGRLVPYKGADMLLSAAAAGIRAGEIQVEIIGDGPQRPELELFAAREELAGGVHFTGWLDHKQVPARLAEHDLFVLPSIREFGGGAVLEAMAVGVPAAVVNYGGPGELVDSSNGWAVELGTREAIVERLARLFDHCRAHPEEVDAKGAAALEFVQTRFTWDAKAQKVLRQYEQLLDRPDSAQLEPNVPRPTPSRTQSRPTVAATAKA